MITIIVLAVLVAAVEAVLLGLVVKDRQALQTRVEKAADKGKVLAAQVAELRLAAAQIEAERDTLLKRALTAEANLTFVLDSTEPEELEKN